jgi:hypothetical protein
MTGLMVVRPVVHRRQNAIDLQSRVKAIADLVDGLHQECDAPHGEELALQRDDHAVGSGQRIDSQQPQRGLTVDQDDVVVVNERTKDTGQHHLAGNFADQLNLSRGQVDVGREDVEVLGAGVLDHVVDVVPSLDQEVVDRDIQLLDRDAQADRQGALRVEVDKKHLASTLREGCAEVDGGRRLAHATLLVAQRDDARRTMAVQQIRLGELGHDPAGGPHLSDSGTLGAG